MATTEAATVDVFLGQVAEFLRAGELGGAVGFQLRALIRGRHGAGLSSEDGYASGEAGLALS